jgi:alkanesulfonate monooxygenase SsuD/methylene tetrahydromethanopterin reductase-like flavin-dependent oxidoreductase (luciferase family)
MEYSNVMLDDRRDRFKVGLFLSTRLAKQVRMAEPAELLAFCRAVETAGFDSLWLGDSLLARPRFEPLTMLAAIAASTSRVALGTAVLLAALRHPLLLRFAIEVLPRLRGK